MAHWFSRDARASRGRHHSAIAVMLATVGCAPPGQRVPDAELRAHEHTLEAPGTAYERIGYLRGGNAHGMRVLLVHGTPGSAAGWGAYVRTPPAGTEVLAIDRPGFGRSGPAGAVPDLAAQAQAVAALLPADGRPAILLGHSLGGPIVARVAAEHPERVAAVILLAASLDPGQEKIHPMQRVGAWPAVRALLPRAIRNANAELMALEPQLHALAPLLPRIVAPVFIVHGTADDLVPVANVPYMQQRLTGARCVHVQLLPGVNHFLPWNSADVVRETIGLAMRSACPTGTR